MSLMAQYTTTTPAFRLTDTPATGYALASTDPNFAGYRPPAVFLQATTHDIRFTTDGSAPTSSFGMVLTAGAAPFFYAGALANLRFIQTASGSVLNVVYAGLQDGAVAGPAGATGATGPTGPTGATGATGP